MIQRYADLAKDRLLNIKARVKQKSAPKILTFKNRVNGVLSNRDITDEDFILPVYKSPFLEGTSKKLFQLSIGGGLTVLGADNHQLLIEVTEDQADQRPDVYFWLLISQLEELAWLNGDWQFFNGKYDGVTETDEIIVSSDGGEEIVIIVGGESSDAQPPIQFQDEGVDVGTPGIVTTINFTGSAVGLSLAGSVLTVDITGSSSSGTVTSVGFTGGLISVATPTTTPALTVAGTSGGIPYFSSTSTWASSALLAANALMIGGGAGAAPATTTTGTGVLTFLGTPSWTNFNSMITGTAPFWKLTGTSTLTGNVLINGDFNVSLGTSGDAINNFSVESDNSGTITTPYASFAVGPTSYFYESTSGTGLRLNPGETILGNGAGTRRFGLFGSDFKFDVGSDANEDTYVRRGGFFTRIPVGSNGNVLTVTAGVVGWAASSGSAFNAATDVLTTITADPFNYPASANTIDVFAGRTRGNFQSIFGAYTLPVITVNNNLVLDGNSIDNGALLPSTVYRYGNLIRAELGTGNYTYSNFSVGGETTQQMTARQATTLAAFDGAKTKNFAIAGEIENDALNNLGLTAAQLYTNMSTWYAATKAAGFVTIARTSPRRAYYGTLAGSLPVALEVNRRISAANALLLGTATSYDYIVETEAIPRLSNPRSRVGYFFDDTHPNESGNLAYKDAFITKIRTNLGQTDYTPPRFASWDGNAPDRSMILGPTNDNTLGFITNGKVRAEVQRNGTFVVNGDISPPDGTSDPNYRFGVGTNQGIGMIVTPGLTATNNSDILSALTIQPAYYDNVSYTGVLNDAFRINKYQLNGYGTNLLRITSDGVQFLVPTYTATASGLAAITEGGTITGHTSGTQNYKQVSPAFTFNGNSTGFTGYNIDLANLVRGAFTNTTSKALTISTGSSATTNDVAIEISAVQGTGISLPNHAGSGTAISIVSSSTANGIAIGMTASASFPIVAYKTTGTGAIGRYIHMTASNLSGLAVMESFERSAGSQLAGGGMSKTYTLKSSSNTDRIMAREDVLWVDNTNAAEKGAMVFNVMTGGTLAKALEISGLNVVVGNAALATNATDGFLHIPSCAGAPSGTPTAFTGRIPMIYDSTNNFLYVYNSGWKKSTVYA